MDEFSYWQAAKRYGGEDNRAYQGLAAEAADAGRKLNLTPDEFESGLYQLFDAYSYFLGAMNESSEPKDQRAWYNHFRDARLGKKLGEPFVSQELLSNAAYGYIKGSLRVPSFDRGLVDAFIAQETFAYIDHHAGYRSVLTRAGCFGTLLASGIVWDIFFGTPHWTGFWRGLGIFAVVVFVFWAWPKRGPYVLYRQMKETYQLLTGSVVSVPELRRRVEAARDKGVVWPAELYAVLDDIEARTKVL